MTQAEGQVPEQRFSAAALRAWSTEVFTAAGLPGEDAAVVATVLVRTSLRGFDSHGVSRVPLYVGRLADQEVNPRPSHGAEMRDGTMFYHCDSGLGQVVASAAVRAAIAETERRPSLVCLVEGCGHLSALGIFKLMAAEAQRVAVLCQPTKPWMALPGWTSRAIGNNPLSLAAPVLGSPPLVFDMAASVASRGAVMDARREGHGIPEGWAIGADGLPTTDAEEAAAGSMLPVGDYKGMGLAMLVECLGASAISRLGETPGGRSRPGAFLLVLNPELTVGADFAADMAAWLDRYRGAAPGGPARYPGLRAAEWEAERRLTGIPLSAALCRGLDQAGKSVGVPFDLTH